MKTNLLVVLPLVAALAHCYADEYSVWDPDGYGNWSDATRWKDGKLPSNTRNVRIESADAYVTDVDYSIVTNLSRVRFRGKASLDLRFDEDHLDFSVNTIMNDSSGESESTLIKSGSGLLVHSSLRNGFSVNNLVVTNGTLRLDVLDNTWAATNMVLGSYGPGRLVFNAQSQLSFNARGLVGDGAVSNMVTSAELRLFGDSSSVFKFSGVLEGDLRISLVTPYVRQYFTGADAMGNHVLRLYGGTLGVKSLGASGSSGTLGPGSDFCWFRGDSEVVYVGSGETSDKIFKFSSDCAAAAIDVGGGDLTLTGEWAIKDIPGSVPVYLRGTNQNVAVFSGAINGYATNVAEIVKQGSGVWRLAGSRGDTLGTISVEDGTLEYTSVSNRGVACSLGSATRLFAPTNGVLSNLSSVPWAIRLGTHSTTGVLAYVGADDVSCTSRLFAVSGTGVVRSDSSAALYYAGATSYDSNGGTLILEGGGDYDNFSNITNGVGVLAVEKKGAGTWTLGGDVVVGGVSVREGVLRIANMNAYRWFRYTVKKLWGDSEQYLQLSQLGFYDEYGSQQNLNLARSESAKARTVALSPGEVAWDHAYSLSGTGRDVERLFLGFDATMSGGKGSVCPDPTKQSTWFSFTMRLADNAQPVRYYDVKSHQGYSAGQMYSREPKQWVLEGSVDGRNWVLLDEQSFTSNPISGGSASKRWYSCDKTAHDAEHKGYPIGDPSAHEVALGSVFVASGATLEADTPVEIDRLVLDADGGGTLRNFAFARNGTIEVPSLPRSGAFVPMTFANVTGLENIRNWDVSVNGIVSDRLKARGSVGGIDIHPNGLVIFFR